MRENIQFDKCTVKSASLLGNSKYWRSFSHYDHTPKIFGPDVLQLAFTVIHHERCKWEEREKNLFSHRAFQVDNTFPLIGV